MGVKTGDPEKATPKRVRTCRPKYSDTLLSREWRINMPNKKIKKQSVGLPITQCPPLTNYMPPCIANLTFLRFVMS